MKRAYNGTVCLFCRDLFGSWVGVVYQEVEISVQFRNSTRDVFFFQNSWWILLLTCGLLTILSVILCFLILKEVG